MITQHAGTADSISHHGGFVGAVASTLLPNPGLCRVCWYMHQIYIDSFRMHVHDFTHAVFRLLPAARLDHRNLESQHSPHCETGGYECIWVHDIQHLARSEVSPATGERNGRLLQALVFDVSGLCQMCQVHNGLDRKFESHKFIPDPRKLEHG